MDHAGVFRISNKDIEVGERKATEADGRRLQGLATSVYRAHRENPCPPVREGKEQGKKRP